MEHNSGGPGGALMRVLDLFAACGRLGDVVEVGAGAPAPAQSAPHVFRCLNAFQRQRVAGATPKI